MKNQILEEVIEDCKLSLAFCTNGGLCEKHKYIKADCDMYFNGRCLIYEQFFDGKKYQQGEN